ncbi:mycothiol conjugate amidase Mca [Mycobacterium sp. CBMA271]|uniref:mycothiol conjugate amidase Mca n=1 Tax=unclassified Mycobacteroides TaxID=2618759 RepID=UPI0012DBCE0D|nr:MULTISPECIES: mycothiol conjugate amidase Mca [unclassified Mycobacteroides]MUM19793.1 mycothiol conjugate amidase Mca [Mycobacteroides sp. CBMA 326]MUM21050.1 mycothiol conjugate amidase Mca [Mycobacteroides sp. CBMA 271]
MRLLAVHAHPDDESSRGAATLAMYAAEGHEVLVVTATGGERGDILNPAMDLPGVRENLTQVRRDEMAAAASALGVQHRWLGYMDSGLHLDPAGVPDDGFARMPLADVVGRLVEVIRDFKPDVLLTYNECGGYPHPDHLRCHEMTIAAYERCPEVSKLYYIHEPVRVTPRMVRNFERAERLRRRVTRKRAGRPQRDRPVIERSLVVPRWVKAAGVLTRSLRRAVGSRQVTSEIACSDYFELRDKALRAHASQLDPGGHFLVLPWTWRQQLWPTERYELVYTRVASETPETDLFAGL